MVSLVSLLRHYVVQDAVCNFDNNMIKESKYCNELIKKPFNKELVITKKVNEDLESSTKCWICNNDYVDNDVKAKDHCHIIGKYKGSAHKDRNIFLSIWVFFDDHSRVTRLQGKGKGMHLTPHYYFHPIHRHLDII